MGAWHDGSDVAEEKTVEPALHWMPPTSITLKEHYPDALVGYEQYGNFEFYGEDAKRVSELLAASCWKRKPHLAK